MGGVVIEVHDLDLLFGRAGNERFRYQPMNGPVLSTVLTSESVSQFDQEVSAAVCARRQDPACLTPGPSETVHDRDVDGPHSTVA